MAKRKKARFSEEEINILVLPEKIPASEVAKKIRLSGNSNILDRLSLELTPYLILPISLIGKNKVEWIILIAPTQSGKTVFLQVAVADAIDQDPGTLMYILPDENSVKRQFKEKIIDMIRATPDLAKHARHSRALTLKSCDLDNMTIYPGWSGSLATLSSTPAKKVILDEVRLMKLTIGAESNAIKLANDRLTTFRAMGLAQGYMVSTPSVEGDLLHQQLSVPGTKVYRWHHRCENCGSVELLDFFRNIKFDVETKEVSCKCSSCGHKYKDDDRKRAMNYSARYLDKDGNEVDMDNLPKRIVFWFDSIASPFRSFDAIFSEYIQTKDKLNDYKNFIQAWLARFWIEDISKSTEESLHKNDVPEQKGIVPSWCKVLTGGVDTQGDGFYCSIHAWGTNQQHRVIDQYFLECKINTAESDQMFKILNRDMENRVWRNHKGDAWTLGMWAIDSGGNRTQQVYNACYRLNKCILVKGAHEEQKTTWTYNKEIDLYLVRTSEYLTETEDKSLLHNGSFELPDGIDNDFYNQFLNARKVREIDKKTGKEKYVWVKKGQTDYRMACVHGFICLDIPTDVGFLRYELHKDDFSYNPLVKQIESQAVDTPRSEDQPTGHDDYFETMTDEDGDYEIGSFSERW